MKTTVMFRRLLLRGACAIILCAVPAYSQDSSSQPDPHQSLVKRVESLEAEVLALKREHLSNKAKVVEILNSVVARLEAHSKALAERGDPSPPASFSEAQITTEPADPTIFIRPKSVTALEFDSTVAGGWKRKTSPLTVDRRGNLLVVFSDESLTAEGEALIVQLEDGRVFRFRFVPATPEHPEQTLLKIRSQGDNGSVSRSK